ncbi:MAG: hypothetical protein VXY86_01520 [Pseudomonadota bacterium]|nr:hypothetical protein [Pseudomonadota bacterium]
MTMIEVNSVDAIPGEAELLAVAVEYIAARLFTLRQRKTLSVMIDVTSQQVRVPVTRAMLGPQRSGLGTKAPTMFEMTVSTAAGIRDAAETITHELLHISQAVNGRLTIVSKRKKINGRKMAVDVVRWMGGKPIIIENLAWHLRPWEIEACHWQSQLVDEFLNLAAGNVADQPLQSGKRQQLALYPVKPPSIVPAQPEPNFDHALGETTTGEEDNADRIASNGESIDRVISGAMPAIADVAPPVIEASDQTDFADELPKQTDDLPGETGINVAPDQDVAAESSKDRPESVENSVEMVSGTAVPTLPAALPDTPVYPRPVIEVEVPGLDAPRALERDAMMKKLDEFRQRGLANAGGKPEAK